MDIEKIVAKQYKEAIQETTLPNWVLTGIRQWAYDIGHSNGQIEVHGLAIEWISIFEELQKSEEKKDV